MKKVVLIGDSIRFQYQEYVKKALKDVAEIYASEDSARFSGYTLRFLHNWVQDGNWRDDIDVVHWNAGLWDVLRLYGDDVPLSTKEYYALNVQRIDRALRLFFPKAKRIFATSTRVIESRYDEWWVCRRNEDIQAYNQAAVEALQNTDAVINDLYALTENFPESYYCDPTHFTEEQGVPLLGDKVAEIICETAGIPKTAIKDATGTKMKKVPTDVFGQ